MEAQAGSLVCPGGGPQVDSSLGGTQPVKVAGTSRPTARCAVRQHMLCSEHIWCGRGEEGR